MADPTDFERLCGTWRLVSWERFRAGRLLELPLGPQPVGLLTYDPAGFVQVQTMARDRTLETFRNPRDAANAGLRGATLSREQASELAEVYTSFAGYAGTFEIDRSQPLIRHHLWTGIDPGMVKRVQERIYRFIGQDGLELRIKPYLVDGVEHDDALVWRRARPGSTPEHEGAGR
ncbi:MAG TPA: lipocalin-like domain-containing protein [Novosphingobium sp.]